MSTHTKEEQQIFTNINEVLPLLKDGKFMDAMRKYLHDDVKLYEGNKPPKVGKELCLAKEEELLATVTEFIRYEVISGPAVKGNTSFYEAVMEFVTNDGKKNIFEQVVRSQWKDGLIINERYYHV